MLSQHSAVVAELAACCRRRVGPLVADALGALLVGEELTDGARRTVHRLTEAGVVSRVNCWLNANLTRGRYRRLARAGGTGDGGGGRTEWYNNWCLTETGNVWFLLPSKATKAYITWKVIVSCAL